MATNAVGSMIPNTGTANANRLSILLIDGGSQALREVLFNQLLNWNLQNKKTHVTGLIPTKLSQQQFDVLYPVSGQTSCLSSLPEVLLEFVIKDVLQVPIVPGITFLEQITKFLGGKGIEIYLNTVNYKAYPCIRKLCKNQKYFLSELGKTKNINDLDITLLCFVLYNFFNINPTSGDITKNPSLHDVKVGDDIVRIRMYRNMLCHKKDAGISQQTFDDSWKEISDVLIRLIGPPFRSELQNLEVTHLDPAKAEEFMKLLNEWQRQEEEIKEFIEENTEAMVAVIQKESEISRTDMEHIVRRNFSEMNKENEVVKDMIRNVTQKQEETQDEGQTVISLLHDQDATMKKIDIKTTAQNKQLGNISQTLGVHTEKLKTVVQSPEAMRQTVHQLSFESSQKLPSDFMKAQVNTWESEETCFSETRASKAVTESLNGRNHVTIKGCPGSGKSSIAKHIAIDLKLQGYHVYILSDPVKIDQYYADGLKQVFVFDDPVGEHALDKVQVSNWKKHSEGIKSLFKGSNTKIIITVRSNIMNSKELKGTGNVLSENTIDINDESLKLNQDERIHMFKSHCPERTIPYEVHNCSFDCFPLLCHVLSQSVTSTFDQTCLFENPFGIIKELFENIETCNPVQFCGLVLCALVPDLEEDVFDLSLNSEDLQDKRMIVDDIIRVMEPSKSYNVIKKELDLLFGVYVSRVEGMYSFIHTIFKDTVLRVVGESKVGFVFKYYPSDYLCQIVRIGRRLFSDIESDSYLILPDKDSVWKMFIQRVEKDLTLCRFEIVLMNPYVSYFPIETAILDVIERIGPAINDHHDGNNMTLLSWAVHANNLSITEYLLKCDGNVNQSYRGTSLLEQAIRNDSMEMIMLLLEYNVDINFQFKSFYTAPLCYAIRSRNLAAVELFIERGAQVGFDDLKTAIQHGDLKILKLFLDRSVNSDYLANQDQLFDFYSGVLFQSNPQTTLLKIFTNTYQSTKLHGDYAVRLLSNAIDRRTIDTIDTILTCIPIEPLNDEQKASLRQTACRSTSDIEDRLIKYGIPVPLMDGFWYHRFINNAENKKEAIECLLENGANVDCQDGFGKTSLFIECRDNNIEIVKMLCERNADVNIAPSIHESAFMSALENENADILILLLQHGAKVHEIDFSYPLVVRATSHNNIKILELLLDFGVNVNRHFEGQDTALIISCRNNNMDMVKLLLNRGADTNILGENSESVLSCAIIQNNIEMLELLINSGLDLNFHAAIALASVQNNLEVVRLLSQYDADVNRYPEGCNTALVYAAWNNNKGMIECLLENGSNVNLHETDRDSALITAAQKADIGVVEFLLDHGADANVISHSETTALFWAAYRNNHDMVELLLHYTDSKIIECDKAICEACRHDNVKMVELLLEHGSCANVFDKHKTPIVAAARNNNVLLIQLLLENGADINCHEKGQFAAFPFAVYNNNIELVELLLRYGADVNFHNECQLAAIPAAVCNGNVELVKFLLKHCAKVNRQGTDNNTALAAAVQDEEILKLLLNHGADVNEHGMGCVTTLTLAASCQLWRMNSCLWKCVSLNEYDISCIYPFESKFAHLDVKHLCLPMDGTAQMSLKCRVCNKDHVGKTANLKCIELLLENGADINLHDEGVDTALIRATQNKDSSVVKMLLESGADVNLQGECGKTALINAMSLLDDGSEIIAGYSNILPVTIIIRDMSMVRNVIRKLDSGYEQSLFSAPKYLESREEVIPSENSVCTHREDITIVQLIKNLIEHGADVNLCDENRISPLLLAVSVCNVEIVNVLLDNGADVNIQDCNGTSALMAAVLGRFQNIGPRKITEYEITMNQRYFKIVEHLMRRSPDITQMNVFFETVLDLVVQRGDSELLDLLLNFTSDKKYVDKYLWTLLHGGIEYTETLKIILDHGADVNAIFAYQKTPLIIALQESQKTIERNKDKDIKPFLLLLELLIQHGANVNFKLFTSETPLEVAIKLDNKDFMNCLINNGADINDPKSVPLLYALENRKYEIVEFLIHRGADVNIIPKYRGEEGRALLRALHLRDYKMIELLLEHGADMTTALIFVVRNEIRSKTDVLHDNDTNVKLRNKKATFEEMITLLLNKGADIHSTNEFGQTPLYIAIIDSNETMAQSLVDHGANINFQSNRFNSTITPLIGAVTQGSIKMIKFCLKNRADINLYTDTGCLPLADAIYSNNKITANYLINHGADINFEVQGKPLLCIAANSGENILKLLLYRGADVNKKAEGGETALSEAAAQNNMEMLQFLLHFGADISLCQDGDQTIIHRARSYISESEIRNKRLGIKGKFYWHKIAYQVMLS